MTIVDLDTSNGIRYWTTVCAHWAAKYGTDYTSFCKHLSEHSFEYLEFEASPRLSSGRNGSVATKNSL